MRMDAASFLKVALQTDFANKNRRPPKYIAHRWVNPTLRRFAQMSNKPNSIELERQKQAVIKKLAEIARKESKKKQTQEKEKISKVK